MFKNKHVDKAFWKYFKTTKPPEEYPEWCKSPSQRHQYWMELAALSFMVQSTATTSKKAKRK